MFGMMLCSTDFVLFGVIVRDGDSLRLWKQHLTVLVEGLHLSRCSRNEHVKQICKYFSICFMVMNWSKSTIMVCFILVLL